LLTEELLAEVYFSIQRMKLKDSTLLPKIRDEMSPAAEFEWGGMQDSAGLASSFPPPIGPSINLSSRPETLGEERDLLK